MLLGTYTLSNKGYRSKKSDMSINEKKKVLVVGHKNPDTDSICAAIAYANLKNQAILPQMYPAHILSLHSVHRHVLPRIDSRPPDFSDLHKRWQHR